MSAEEFKYDPNAEKWVDPYPKKKSGWHNGLIAVVIVLVIYVLSIGPITRFVKNGSLSFDVLIIYSPLLWVEDKSEATHRLFNWYVDVWDEKQIIHP